MTEETKNIICDIEKDINYFKNIGFDILVSKFERDLGLIKTLVKETGENI